MFESLEVRRMLSTTLYVDAAAPGPTHDGSSWSAAYADLQQALGAAVPGDSIYIAQGTYKPTAGTDRTATFQLKSGVGIYGGYAGNGAADPDVRDVSAYATILSGDIGAQGYEYDNSYHVVTGSGTDSTADVDGFTITGGMADAMAPSPGRSSGGGMLVVSGNPTINNCVFSGNTAYGCAASGGAMFNSMSSSPLVTNCVFSMNTAFGIDAADDGSTSRGGAVTNDGSSPTFIDCAFLENSAIGDPTALGFGGALADVGGSGASKPRLIRCLLRGNNANNSGGAIYNEYTSLLVNDCMFDQNAAVYGGGIENEEGQLTLNACTFSSDHAANFGGAIYSASTSLNRITNCTFSNNSARDGGRYQCGGGDGCGW
jgi:predicted outer membrane repeat protein